MTGKQNSLARNGSDLWERLTVGGVVVILVAFAVLFVTTLCSAQLPR
jgi:ABC-type dipeptide/oligopeptide/nickel transport system permease subunit